MLGVWSDDDHSARLRGAVPLRASRIEVIASGPSAGRFFVDFSLLAESEKRDDFAICLTKTFDSYTEAVATEVDWLKRNYLLGGSNEGQTDRQ